MSETRNPQAIKGCSKIESRQSRKRTAGSADTRRYPSPSRFPYATKGLAEQHDRMQHEIADFRRSLVRK